MQETPNPYETPQPPEGEVRKDPRSPDLDKRGMLSLIAGTSILAGIDFSFPQTGFAVVGPAILFFVLAFWSVMAGTRGGKMSILKRLAVATLASVFAAPSFFALLVFTCVPATEVAGASWDIHRGVPYKNRIVFGLVSGILVGLVGLLMYGLMYLLPAGSGGKTKATH